MMSTGPITSSLTGILAGKMVDRFGVSITTIVGLSEMVIGVLAMSRLPPILGGPGYVISSILLSPGYQMFQAANITGVMSKVMSEQRGVISGMLSLSRNLGLITGTSLMGAIFSFAAGTTRIAIGSSKAVTHGMQVTFSFAAVLAVLALLIAIKLSKSNSS
jgi:MFS family permease